MKVAVTGHRPPRLKGKEQIISQWIYDKLLELNNKDKIIAAYNGMAAGADQLFALQCIKLGIPVYCVFPYNRKKYHPDELYIIERAAGSIALQDEYSRDSYYKRDCFMVDNCDVLIAIWDGIPQGGTYITIDYARKQGKPIIYLPQGIL